MNPASPQAAQLSATNRWFLPAVVVAALGSGVVGYSWSTAKTVRFGGEAVSSAVTKREELGASGDKPTDGKDERSADLIESFITSFNPSRGPLGKEHDLFAAIQDWTVEDFRAVARDDAVKARILKKLNPSAHSSDALIGGFVDRWMELDPDSASSAIAWASSIQNDDEWAADAIFEAVGERVPEAILSRIKALRSDLDGLSPSEKKDRVEQAASLAETLLWSLSETDPAKAERLVADFSGEPNYNALKSRWLFRVARSDPLRAVDLIDPKWPEFQDRQVWFAAIEEAKMRGLGMLGALQEKTKDLMLRAYIANSITELDLDEGMRIAQELITSHPEKGDIPYFKRITDKLARSDPQRAMEWVASLPETARRALYPVVAADWISADPQRAMQWFSENSPVEPDNSIRSKVLVDDPKSQAFQCWLKADEQAARAWILTQTPENRTSLEAGLADFLVETGRVSEAAQRFGESPLADISLARKITQNLAYDDPLKAMEWAVDLPAGPNQDVACTVAIKAWSGAEPKAAGEWLQQLPSGSLRDRTIAAYASSISSIDASSATAWLSQIEDPWQRSRAARNVYRHWNSRDPKGARVWLEKVEGLDPALKRITLGELK